MKDDESRLVEQFGRQRPFVVPKGYFEQLAEAAETNVRSQERPARNISLWQRSYKPLAVAACACTLVGMAIWLIPRSNEVQQTALNVKTDSTKSQSKDVAAKSIVAENTMQKASILPNPFETGQNEAQTVDDKKASKVVEAAPQIAVSTSSPVEKTIREEASDPLDVAADLIMGDADDLYAMLSDE